MGIHQAATVGVREEPMVTAEVWKEVLKGEAMKADVQVEDALAGAVLTPDTALNDAQRCWLDVLRA